MQPTCIATFKSGKAKGEICGRKVYEGVNFCKMHSGSTMCNGTVSDGSPCRYKSYKHFSFCKIHKTAEMLKVLETEKMEKYFKNKIREIENIRAYGRISVLKKEKGCIQQDLKRLKTLEKFHLERMNSGTPDQKLESEKLYNKMPSTKPFLEYISKLMDLEIETIISFVFTGMDRFNEGKIPFNFTKNKKEFNEMAVKNFAQCKDRMRFYNKKTKKYTLKICYAKTIHTCADPVVYFKEIEKDNLFFLENVTTPDTSECCSICLLNFKEKSKVKKLKCNHLFHNKCLGSWWNGGVNNSCPLCREPLVD